MDQSLGYCHIGSSASIWKSPQPFVTDKESLPSFPTDCLPSVVCEFVKAAAIATSTDKAMAATAVLSAFSGCIAGAYRAVGKPGHSEPLTLYTLIVADPGERKSPIMRYVREPLDRCVSLYNDRRRQDFYRNKEQKRILVDEIEKLRRTGGSAEDIAAKQCQADCIEDTEELVLCIDDVTPEALSRLLSQNRALIMLSDEAGMLKNFGGRYSNGIPNLDLLLKCWSGETYRKDRCNGEALLLKEPYLSVCLCAQPYIVENLMSSEYFRSSGLTARFLYTFPKSYVGIREYDTPDIPVQVKGGYHSIVFSAFNSRVVFRKRNVPLFLSEDGRQKFIHYYNTEIEPKLRDRFAECQNWGGKYHGLILRLSGILHCMSEFSKDRMPENERISAETIGNAIRIGEYYTRQAVFAYTQNEFDKSIAGAEYVLRKLTAKQINEITPRELLHTCRKFKTMEELRVSVELLIEHGYIKEDSRRVSGQKTKTFYLVNPCLFENDVPNVPEP